MGSTYIALSSTVTVPDSTLQWPLIHPFTHTLVYEWVAAALQGTASPAGSSVLSKDTSNMWTVAAGIWTANPRISSSRPTLPTEPQLHHTSTSGPIWKPKGLKANVCRQRATEGSECKLNLCWFSHSNSLVFLFFSKPRTKNNIYRRCLSFTPDWPRQVFSHPMQPVSGDGNLLDPCTKRKPRPVATWLNCLQHFCRL